MKTGKSIRGALSYNEQKVRQGNADLILAKHFGQDISDMGFSEKLARFEKLTTLNERTKTNVLHLSLNFSPDDHLNLELLQSVAGEYMEQIGFGNQPFLVYQHNDTGHPHLHIVTTTIQANGRPMYLHNIGKTKSEPARKAIELEYGLIQAESRKLNNSFPLKPISLQAASYGQIETKRNISNIIQEVIARYKFTSLDEFNTILRQFNITADRGSNNSNMFQKKGLLYCLLDAKGYKTGIPIKASSIYGSPTFSLLERKFQLNQSKKLISKDFTKKAIEYAFQKGNTIEEINKLLNSKDIICFITRSKEREIEKLLFLDNRNKSVFSNDELGIPCNILSPKINSFERKTQGGHLAEISNLRGMDSVGAPHSITTSLLYNLLSPEYLPGEVLPEFLKKKRKKRKR